MLHGLPTATHHGRRRAPSTVVGLLAALALAACDAGVVTIKDDTAVDTDTDAVIDSDPCVPTGDDEPDPDFIDANCDGIDGDASRAVFVATTGDDAAAGTRAAPMATVAAAILKAKITAGLDHVYVSAGSYDGTVTLGDGVSVWGMFAANQDWRRDPLYTTTLAGTPGPDGTVVTVVASDITSRTVFADLNIHSGEPVTYGASSIGIIVQDCQGLVLERLQVLTSNGADGRDGEPGARGADGGDGDPGQPGTCAVGCGLSSGGAGGAGGASPCGNVGATGTEGWRANNVDALNCVGGNPSGVQGDDGEEGTDGGDGAGGSGGALVDGRWVGADGASGTPGDAGGAGAAGGPGGSYCNLACGTRQSGAGGGGGGGGACGGDAGEGGGAGGASIGVVLSRSPLTILRESAILVGKGGDGGAGGDRGDGGDGGIGGPSTAQTCGLPSVGAAGGAGGAGGRGGSGGGGTGGPSYAVWVQGTSTTAETNTLGHGAAGSGGTSQGNPGDDGEADFIKLEP